MEKFTQLNLQNYDTLQSKPEAKSFPSTNNSRPLPGGQKPTENKPGMPQPNGNKRGKKFDASQKTAAVICSFLAVSLMGVALLETSGCSKASNNASLPS